MLYTRTAQASATMVEQRLHRSNYRHGTGMTLQVTVAGKLQLQLSNFKSGSDYQFQMWLKIPAEAFELAGTGSVQIGLTHRLTSGTQQ